MNLSIKDLQILIDKLNPAECDTAEQLNLLNRLCMELETQQFELQQARSD